MAMGARPQEPERQRTCLAQDRACLALPSWCVNVCLHITVVSGRFNRYPQHAPWDARGFSLAAAATFLFPATGLGTWRWEITVMALFRAQLFSLCFTICKVGGHYNPFLPWGHKESMNESQKGVLWDLWVENIPGLLLLVMAHTYSTYRYFKLH